MVRRSRTDQWVVAGRFLSRPAAPRIRLPVQTEVVQVVVAWMVRTQARVSGESRRLVALPPPGMTRMSAWEISERAESAMRRRPESVWMGPGLRAARFTVAPGKRESTSWGPIASRAVMCS